MPISNAEDNQAAGSRAVIDLPGVSTSFAAWTASQPPSAPTSKTSPAQRRLGRARRRSLPDGDADLDQIDLSGFVVPRCASCGGILKQDVVFFGERVPRDQVAAVNLPISIAA